MGSIVMAEKYSAKMTEAEKTARRNQRMEELKTARAEKFTQQAQARATTKVPVVQAFQNDMPGYEAQYGAGAPTFNAYDITTRPQPLIPADDNFIYFYSWIGGATTGMWRLYRADKTQENLRKYGSRVFGGKTQARFGTSSFGANSLVTQPKPVLGPNGDVVDWQLGNQKLSALPDVRATGSIKNVPGMTDYIDSSAQFDDSLPVDQADTGSDLSLPPGSIPVGNMDAFTDAFGMPRGSVKMGFGPAQSGSTARTNSAYEDRQAAFDVLYKEMAALGLEALVEPLRGLLIEDVSPSEFNVRLRDTEAFKLRFAANEARRKKGLRTLQPGEYIQQEDNYRQLLRTAGLTQFDSDAYVQKFIENDVSARELGLRITAATDRVKNANPAVLNTLKEYYPQLGQNDLVGYLLDPTTELDAIERKITASEIGAAARVQGLGLAESAAMDLATQGVTQARAQQGFSRIAEALPTAEKLSNIYGSTMDQYRQEQAQQEEFLGMASARRRRQRLVGREVAEFGGASGVGRGALGSELRGQI